MRKSKRAILKSKVYGFNPWADQVPAINQIMEETGQRSEAPVVRDLVDEALTARRRNAGPAQTPDQPLPDQGVAETLQTIQTLLLTMIAEEETVSRMHGVTLELMQETLVEARAGRRLSWTSLVVPLLREKGLSSEEIERQFDAQTKETRSYAYGLADQIKTNQESVGGEPEGLPTQALLF
jgi:hypothetical protein